jgi:hypothetical protein
MTHPFEWLKEAEKEAVENQHNPFIPYSFRFTEDSAHIQFWGCEVVLTKDGKWFMNDTSGG